MRAGLKVKTAGLVVFFPTRHLPRPPPDARVFSDMNRPAIDAITERLEEQKGFDHGDGRQP